jgi:hypothetical protein
MRIHQNNEFIIAEEGGRIMKRNAGFSKLVTLVLLMFTVLAIPVASFGAEEAKPTGDITTAVLSQYVWRGYELSRNSVVIQPSMTIGYKGFSANLWGNLDTKPYSSADASYSDTWNETDLTLSYSTTLGLFNLGGGYIYYSLAPLNKGAADRAESQELFATVSLNTLLSPTLTVYKEIAHYRNWYALLGISHVFELNQMLSLKLGASASYLLSTDEATYPKFDGNATATTDKFSNFHDGVLSASLPIKATDRITITPMLSYIFPLTDDAKNEMKGFGLEGTATPAERDSSFLVGGLTVSFSF